jgi:hypothetical protein
MARFHWAPILCLASALVGAVALPVHPAGPQARDELQALPYSESGEVALTVDPSTWNMLGGSTTVLSAVWGAPAPACVLVPEWYRWTLPAPPLSGTLNRSSGAQVAFAADVSTPGRTTVVVSAAAVVECGSTESIQFATAFANVTVVAPLTLDGLSIDPAPLSPDQPTLLTAEVGGGDPPYSIEVNWTDGTTTVLSVLAPGMFTVPHAFPAGTFQPRLTALDSSGLVARATVPETLDVSATAAVALDPSHSVTDVDVPVAWNATIERAGDLYVTTPECDGIVTGSPGFSNATEGSCTFRTVGSGSISIAVGMAFGQTLAGARSTELVVPSPTVQLGASSLPVEVGRPGYLIANVSGGVPPLSLVCVGPSIDDPVRLSSVADGPVAVPVEPLLPGLEDFTVEVVDALGIASDPATVVVPVAPALNVSLEFGHSLDSTGATLSAAGTVAAGPAPFVWIVAPSTVGPGAAAATGTLGGPGSFNWSGLYLLDGSLQVAVAVVDAAGEMVTAARPLPMAPPLSVLATVVGNLSAPPDEAQVSLAITGGLPPFNVSIASSTGATWNMSSPSDGPAAWRLAFPAGGVVRLEIIVRDATGATASENTSVVLGVPHPAPAAPASDAAVLALAGVIALVGLVAAGWGWVRHRRPHASPPPPDPVSILRGIIAPADGADRSTVELLAEEAGVPLTTVRATLDRLIADGAVRSEVDGDGSEVVAWERDPSP